MLTYLDESYGNGLLLIGTLHLISNSSKKFLHSRIKEIKQKHKYITKDGQLKEVKYSQLNSKKTLTIAREMINSFKITDKAIFRGSIINYSTEDIQKIRPNSNIDLNIKKAMLYTKSVEQLIKNTYKSNDLKNGILLMDNLVRCKGDKFDKLMQEKLVNSKNKYLKHLSYVDSKLENNHTIQVCDLLLGAVRCAIVPPKRGKYKKLLSKYVLNTLDLPTFDIKYWKKLRQGLAEMKHPKFTLRNYKVPYKY